MSRRVNKYVMTSGILEVSGNWGNHNFWGTVRAPKPLKLSNDHLSVPFVCKYLSKVLTPMGDQKNTIWPLTYFDFSKNASKLACTAYFEIWSFWGKNKEIYHFLVFFSKKCQKVTFFCMALSNFKMLVLSEFSCVFAEIEIWSRPNTHLSIAHGVSAFDKYLHTKGTLLISDYCLT